MISVIDSDGEFLLIEAAECLPNWANPDNCDQRVILFFFTIRVHNVINLNLLIVLKGLYK